MTSQERVLTSTAFRQPDRIPCFDSFWEFPESWKQAFKRPEELSDIAIWVPEEGIFPTRARKIREDGAYVYSVDSWGRAKRSRKGAYFYEVIEPAIPAGMDIDSLEFDPPDLDERFLHGEDTLEETWKALERDKEQFCVFGKIGGPYLRTAFVQGQEQFLMDIAGDYELAKALVERIGIHLTAVGCEEIRRWKLQETGIWIYDDMGSNAGPMFSPASFERIFLPAYRNMIQSYKKAGARYVFLHSDGNIRPILDMLVDAGIDGLNPLEKRAGMDIREIRKAYPKLILTGGMDNTDTLINGPEERIIREAKEIIDLGKDGGIIIGTHSISPEIPLKFFQAYHRTCLTYGCFI
jgi:uroporphyrinogen decarboxylase